MALIVKLPKTFFVEPDMNCYNKTIIGDHRLQGFGYMGQFGS